MSNYSSLKSAIDANIKANGRREITGPVLNAILNAVVNSLGDGYLFRGVAIPSTNPGTPDQNVAYLAITEGTYTHMGGLSVTDGELSVFSYNGAWSKIPLALVPTKTSQLDNDLRFVTSEEMGESLSSKQDTIQDLSEIRSGAALGSTAYQKPSTGIPSSDMTDTVQQAISFAESTEKRSYNSSNPDGMGYLVLKKNKTFAEQVTQQNTIYEIRYPFDLGGASVTIPTGCVLKFDGGSLLNGTLVGSNTKIDACAVKIFDALSLSGSFDVVNAYPEWFGAISNDSAVDSRLAIQKCIDYFKIVIVTGKYYFLSTNSDGAGLTLTNPVTIIGKNNNEGEGRSTFIMNSISKGLFIKTSNAYGSITVSNINIVGGDIAGSICITNNSICSRLSISDVEIVHFDKGIILDCYLSYFKRVVIKDGSYGFVFGGNNSNSLMTSIVLVNCYCDSIKQTSYSFKGIKYSCLISCACDNAGRFNSATDGSYSGLAYSFVQCRTIDVLGCGCEGFKKLIYAQGSTIRFNINATTDYSVNYPIYLDSVTNTVLWGYLEISNLSSVSTVIRAFLANVIPYLTINLVFHNMQKIMIRGNSKMTDVEALQFVTIDGTPGKLVASSAEFANFLWNYSVGDRAFNTTINKAVVFNGTEWVD